MKAMRRPSGDHCGMAAFDASNVSCRLSVPTFIFQRFISGYVT
jgi:hypothetical protein